MPKQTCTDKQVEQLRRLGEVQIKIADMLKPLTPKHRRRVIRAVAAFYQKEVSS